MFRFGLAGFGFISAILLPPLTSHAQVTFHEFSEAKAGSGTTSLTISKPSLTATGDLLIAVLAVEDNNRNIARGLAAPAGLWTTVDIGNTNGNRATLGVWWRIATASEPSTHTFTWSNSDEAYGFVMRFTGHDSSSPIGTYAIYTGNDWSPWSPTVTTTVADTMIVRIGGFDDDSINHDVTGINSGHTDMTMDDSDSSGGLVSGGAAYITQAAIGSSGWERFALTSQERYRTLTLAIVPVGSLPIDHFAISHDGAASSCYAESITITAEDLNGDTATAHTGSITLSTSTGNGDWRIGTGGALGTLTPGAADSGNATYTFAAGDNGEITLELADTHEGTTNIDVVQGAYSEDAGSDSNLVVGACTIPGGVACSVWYDADWTYRKALIVDSSMVSATLTNFPMLVSLSVDADLAVEAMANGYDILFTSSDGLTKLDHEIEEWDNATGELVAWVEVPSLSSSADTVIYLYYGYASATDQGNKTGVWDSNYAYVLHLHDDFNDSTTNGNDAADFNTSDVTGFIGDAEEFDGSGDYLIPSATVENQPEVTLSMWVDADEAVSANGLYNELYNAYFQFSLLQNTFNTRDSSNAPTSSRNNDVSWGPLTTGWHYIVVRYSVSGSIKSVYVDGVRDGYSTNSIDPLVSHQNGIHIASDPYGSDFDGVMDEVRLSHGLARASSWIATEYANQSSPLTFYSLSLSDETCVVASVDHLAISHDANGLNCQSESVTITAHDASHIVQTSYSSSVTLSTSTAHGDWSNETGSGSLANSGGGDATYGFVAGDNGTVTLGLSDSYVETVDVDVTDGSASEDAGEDPSLAFAASGFIFLADGSQSALGTQIGGKTSNVAPGSQVLELQGVRTSDSTGACESFLTNTVSVEMAFECELPTTCTANQVSISGTNVNGNNNGASLVYDNVDLDFGNASDTTAAFTLNYPDVGQIQLHARLALSPSGETLTGASNSVVVRPFAFDVSVAGNTAPTTETGNVLTTAGSDFTSTARAVLWSATDDTDNDGVADNHDDTAPGNNATLSDNAAALNFGQGGEDIDLDATLFAPSPGNDPGLEGGTTIATFVSGSGSSATTYFDEVGIVEISSSVTDGNYLGIGTSATSDIIGRSGTVGRFTPYEFTVSYNTPSFDEGCTTGTFTYMDQPFTYDTQPKISLTAKSEQGTTTQNYKGVWWKITNATLVNRDYTAATGPLDTSGLPGTGSDPAWVKNDNGTGTLTFSSGSGLLFARAATPAAPFNADISVEVDVVDSDSVAFAGNPAKFGAATAGNGIAFTSNKRVRYGRLALSNAHGSELVNLDIPSHAEYYDGTSFVLNDDDSCSSVAIGDVTLTKAPVAISSVATIDNDPLLLGQAGLWLSPAGTGNAGTVDIDIDLSNATGSSLEWLRFDWPNDGDTGGLPTEDPTSRATFGIFKGRDPIIYMRESY